MKNKNLSILVLLAALCILIGIVLIFISTESFYIKPINDGYVVAFFTLAGVFLYFGALMYQVKTFKIQVKELEKSITAQTDASRALEEQNRLYREQNFSSTCFTLIENLNQYKEKAGIEIILNRFRVQYERIFAEEWRYLSFDESLDRKQRNHHFALFIKENLNLTIHNREEIVEVIRFLQISYNILYFIDINKANFSIDIYKPYFFNQLSQVQNIFLHLLNLVDIGVPIYSNLEWSYYTTLDLIAMIKREYRGNIDYSGIDLNQLTNLFNEIKQK